MPKNKLLDIDLDALIKESVRNLFEVSEDESVENMKEKLKQQEKARSSQERRKKMNEDPKAENAGDEAVGDAGDKNPVKLKHEKMPEINIKSVVDKLNSIRSGKSLKDAQTKKALKSYFQKLNGPERIALFAFLSGIDKILGNAEKNVKTPHSSPYKIDMEQETPKTIKRQPKGTKETSSTRESETPIIVGEIANTKHIKDKLWRK